MGGGRGGWGAWGEKNLPARPMNGTRQKATKSGDGGRNQIAKSGGQIDGLRDALEDVGNKRKEGGKKKTSKKRGRGASKGELYEKKKARPDRRQRTGNVTRFI